MAKRLSEEERRLRRLKDGALADEYGALQARQAELKAEAVRRDLRRCEGELFRLTLTPPAEYERFDRRAYERDHGPLPETYFATVGRDWDLRCRARSKG